MRMMILMHDTEDYGRAVLNGKPMPLDVMAQKCGTTPKNFARIFAELEDAGVPSRDAHGVIFSRRMVRDGKERQKWAEDKRKQRQNGDTSTDCPPLSSSSLSSSLSSSKKNIPPTPQRGDEGQQQIFETAPTGEQKKSRAKTRAHGEQTPDRAMILFERFWKAYPRRVSRAKAERAWRRLKPSEQLTVKILQAVERAKTSEDWRKDGGMFIPYPASYLNQRRWEDETEVDLGPDSGPSGGRKPDKFSHVYE
ncbi:MAG TPA: hypothetical protein VFW62_10865 [bacterium]|nr:hypothetical protein [bacterium]